MANTIVLQSVIKCPNCGYMQEETMPTDACVLFYDCAKCHRRLERKAGRCCVFCSYGTVKCPSMQSGATCVATS